MTPHTQQRTTLPVCPECGSATFWNTTDGIQTLFCISDDCKWKQQICSHPHTPAAPSIDVTKCFDEKVFDVAPWEIYRQDAGMGEHDYAVVLNDIFFCRVEHEQHAHEIIRAIRFAANWKNAEAREATIRNQTLDELKSQVEMTYSKKGIMNVCDIFAWIESLRTPSTQEQYERGEQR